MQNIRFGFIALWMLLGTANAAVAGVSIGIGLPNVNIGINLPAYPDLVPVPGYPVYYAPGFAGNYFFYDGMYWVYQNDNWYASTWYNGPWGYVDPMSVPLYVLRVPISYYRQPPTYFRGWHSDAPPRWGDHWGHSWEQRRSGWNHWNRGAAPRPAPLPVYQRQYAGNRYPRAEQQSAIRSEQYHYQPRDKVVREHFKQTDKKAPAAQRVKQVKPQAKSPQHQEVQHAAPQRQGAAQQRGPAAHEQKQQPQHQQPQHQQPAAQHQQPAPQAHEQQRGHEERGGGQEHGQGQSREEGRGR